MKKQERALFIVSLIVLLLVWVMNGNRASAADYNFYFYDAGEGEKKREERQPSQATSSFKTSEAEPLPEEEVKIKTAAVITPTPVRATRRFLPLFLFPFLPDDAYLSLGWEHNTYHDNVRNTSDLAPSVSVKVKMIPFLVLDGSIPIHSYNPGVRPFKIGALTEWDMFPSIIELRQSDSEYKRRWKNAWNFFQSVASPILQLSSGLLYNPRFKYEEHLVVGKKYYVDGAIIPGSYKLDKSRDTGMSRSNLYLGGGLRFRFLNHIDLTASLNFLPQRKWSHLFSAGASVVF